MLGGGGGIFWMLSGGFITLILVDGWELGVVGGCGY